MWCDLLVLSCFFLFGNVPSVIEKSINSGHVRLFHTYFAIKHESIAKKKSFRIALVCLNV